MSPERPKRKLTRRRKILFLLIALAAGLLLAVLLLELGFRLFWNMPGQFAEFEQAGLYRVTSAGSAGLAPGYRGHLKIGDRRTTVTTNSFGMRGAEPPAKSPDHCRILMVGDSLVFGYGVEDDEALPPSLQRALHERGVDAVVGNGGIISFGSSHAVAHMAFLDESFAADAFVVCGYMGNDPVDDTKPDRYVYAGMLLHEPVSLLVKAGSWRTKLALRSRAALWVESWIIVNKPQWSPLANPPIDAERIRRAAGLPPPHLLAASLFLEHRDEQHIWQPGAPPVIPRLLGYLKQSLQRAKEIAGDRPLAFVILPNSCHCDPDKRRAAMRRMQFDPKDYVRGHLQRRWLAVAAELGVPAFDATEVLSAAGPVQDLYVEDGGHLSARGNEVVGGFLAERIGELLK